MPSKLEELRQIIIRGNPEIVELKFGCAVIVELKKGGGRYRTLIRALMSDGSFQTAYGEYKEQEMEVIGRPITLADVLMAISSVSVIGEYSIDAFGYIRQKESNSPVKAKWNLTKSLEEQSPEVISFLHQLLSNHSSKEI